MNLTNTILGLDEFPQIERFDLGVGMRMGYKPIKSEFEKANPLNRLRVAMWVMAQIVHWRLHGVMTRIP